MPATPYKKHSNSQKRNHFKDDTINSLEGQQTQGQQTDDMEDEADAAILCGIKPVLELLHENPTRIDTVFVRRGAHGETGRILDQCRVAGIRFALHDGKELDKLVSRAGQTGIVSHQGVVARLVATGFMELDALLACVHEAPVPLIVALDQVQDPGNVGTLARTLYALGGAGLLVPRHNGAFLGAGARRAAAGALERLPVCRVTNLSRALDDAAEAGLTIYGAALTHDSYNVFEAPLRLPAVLVLGNEERGIRMHVGKRCDMRLHIPMARPFDSLNVAQAGAILTAEFVRRVSVGAVGSA